jgi:hypothetical protein
MLYEVNRHEALSSSSWDAAKAHEYIERVTTDTELRFSREEYWPIHPLEEQPPGTKVHSMYMGTAGVIWGLDYLIRAHPRRSNQWARGFWRNRSRIDCSNAI